ncbi:MAG: SH3 domain-containing protein [Candidatus Omnitrophica bacterium]|nr:SH3 domain-containing protein [Candidatus Omnitrophota bacterium]
MLRVLKISKAGIIILFFLFIQLMFTCFVRECESFQAEVNANNINVRVDSTANSEAICKVNKGDTLEVILELYDWYKITLPKTAPLFIRRDLISFIDNKTAKVSKDNVNVRLRADESSPILGELNKDTTVNVLDDKNDWCKIEPADNTFGWIHKNFLNKISEETKKKEQENKVVSEGPPVKETMTIEGIVKSKIIKHKASHKLITGDNSCFALKGREEDLNAVTGHRARISGRLIQETRIIEIEKIEALD